MLCCPDQPGRVSGLSVLSFVVDDVRLNEVFGRQPFSSLIYNYDVKIAAEKFRLIPHTFVGDASISIKKDGDNTEYFNGKRGDTSDEIMLGAVGTSTILRVVVVWMLNQRPIPLR